MQINSNNEIDNKYFIDSSPLPGTVYCFYHLVSFRFAIINVRCANSFAARRRNIQVWGGYPRLRAILPCGVCINKVVITNCNYYNYNSPKCVINIKVPSNIFIAMLFHYHSN